jgi:hypothetical protein
MSSKPVTGHREAIETLMKNGILINGDGEGCQLGLIPTPVLDCAVRIAL